MHGSHAWNNEGAYSVSPHEASFHSSLIGNHYFPCMGMQYCLDYGEFDLTACLSILNQRRLRICVCGWVYGEVGWGRWGFPNGVVGMVHLWRSMDRRAGSDRIVRPGLMSVAPKWTGVVYHRIHQSEPWKHFVVYGGLPVHSIRVLRCCCIQCSCFVHQSTCLLRRHLVIQTCFQTQTLNRYRFLLNSLAT